MQTGHCHKDPVYFCLSQHKPRVKHIKPISMILDKHQKLLNQLGEHIKTARRLRRLTQQELGLRAQLGRQVVANLEKGVPVKTDSLVAILFVLGLEQQFTDALSLKNDAVGLRLAKTSAIRTCVNSKNAINDQDEF